MGISGVWNGFFITASESACVSALTVRLPQPSHDPQISYNRRRSSSRPREVWNEVSRTLSLTLVNYARPTVQGGPTCWREVHPPSPSLRLEALHATARTGPEDVAP